MAVAVAVADSWAVSDGTESSGWEKRFLVVIPFYVCCDRNLRAK